MKNSHIIFVIILFLTACVSTNQVFFSDPNYLKSDEFSSSETIKEAYSESFENDQDTIIESDEESYFDEENYYDFSYSSRIRRFHRPMMLNYGFYSGFYTDYYWYNADPFYWGSSIYLGYGWDSPFYYSPYYSFYSPYYSFYSPFYYNNHSLWHNHGYHGHHGYHGYHNHNDFYSGFYSNNSTYGPRSSLTSNDRNLIKSNVKSRNTWSPGTNKKFTTNKYTTKKPHVSSGNKNNSNKTVKTLTNKPSRNQNINKSSRDKNNNRKTYSNKKTYKPKSNFRSNNRNTFKSRSNSSRPSGNRNISRSPKRK